MHTGRIKRSSCYGTPMAIPAGQANIPGKPSAHAGIVKVLILTRESSVMFNRKCHIEYYILPATDQGADV